MSRLLMLRIVLGIICASHLLLGAVAFAGLPGGAAETVASLYGGSFPAGSLTPQLQHVGRMLGAYMLAMALLAGVAAADPLRNRVGILVIALLFLERVLQRLLFAGEAQQAFAIPPGRMWAQTLFFLAFPVALLLLYPRTGTTGNGPTVTAAES